MEDLQKLLPVRLKSRGKRVVGNNAKTLGRPTSGYTKAVVFATVESILKSDTVRTSDLHKLATYFDTGKLDFDSYEEEVQSRYGRPALEIIQEEGVEAYNELQNVLESNAYLHAALNDVTVWEAAEELDVQPRMVVDSPDGWQRVRTRFDNPDLVSAGVINDGDIYSTDLREFSPDLEWVINNWETVGGNSKRTKRLANTDELEDLIEEFLCEPEDEVVDTIIVYKERGFTFHEVKEREESIAEEEADRLVMRCGNEVEVSSELTRLKVDTVRTDTKYYCGNCKRYSESKIPA